jgi:hypothetical protein
MTTNTTTSQNKDRSPFGFEWKSKNALGRLFSVRSLMRAKVERRKVCSQAQSPENLGPEELGRFWNPSPWLHKWRSQGPGGKVTSPSWQKGPLGETPFPDTIIPSCFFHGGFIVSSHQMAYVLSSFSYYVPNHMRTVLSTRRTRATSFREHAITVNISE